MFRIDSDGAVASLPDPADAGAVSGYFDPGNPSVGQRATVVSYDWMNAIQETVIDPIENQGLSLRKASPYDLLTEAIQKTLAEAGLVVGLRLSLTSGVLSFLGQDGNALSSSNFGHVPCRSNTAGKKIGLKMATPITLNDFASGSTHLSGIGLGVTEANDWANTLPLFLYSVSKSDSDIADTDGSSAIFISRNPNLHVTPASTLIGKKSTAPATDNQYAIVLLGTTYTVANYASLPCQLIGAIGATWDASDASYTFVALSTTGGLGEEELNRIFGTDWTMPLAQNGAATGTHLHANGGTAPLFSTNTYTYQVRRNGEIAVKYHLSGDGGTDGAGAVSTRMSLPLAVLYVTGRSLSAWGGDIIAATTLTNDAMVLAALVDGNSYCQFAYESSAVQTSNVRNDNFTNGARQISGTFSYKAF
jgi:hypothetical protein